MASPNSAPSSSNLGRLPAIDGLRGLFALVVVINHVAQKLGSQALFPAANVSVCAFFLLSGYVLTRGWDGRYGMFLARRFVRLWPAYALCLGAGCLLEQTFPVWTQFFWYPILNANSKPAIDPPIWSLCIEAWAMLFMPLIALAGRGRVWRAALLYGLAVVASGYCVKFAFGEYFLIGAFLSRWDFHNRFLSSAVPQWLGRISYSLYLTHWLVFALANRYFGGWGVVASVPAAFLVAWLVWRFVERPSIGLSRRVGGFGRAVGRRFEGIRADDVAPRALG